MNVPTELNSINGEVSQKKIIIDLGKYAVRFFLFENGKIAKYSDFHAHSRAASSFEGPVSEYHYQVTFPYKGELKSFLLGDGVLSDSRMREFDNQSNEHHVARLFVAIHQCVEDGETLDVFVALSPSDYQNTKLREDYFSYIEGSENREIAVTLNGVKKSFKINEFNTIPLEVKANIEDRIQKI